MPTRIYEPTDGTPIETVETPNGRRQVMSTPELYETRVSTQNDPPGPLVANETFTGQWEDTEGWSTIMVAVLTDQPSAVQGAVVQFTEDPALGPLRSVATTVPANVGSHFSFGTELRYFRIRYTNGATAQKTLRSEITLRRTPPAAIVQPLGAPTTDNNLASVVRAHLAGRQSSGAWAPLFLDSKGRLHVVDALEARPLYSLSPVTRSTGGSSAGFFTGDLSRIAVDINVTAVSGVGAQIRFFIDRQGADGLWYPVWSPAAVTAPTTLSTTIGQGMAIAQSLAAECRFRWEITGTTPSISLSVGITGK